MFSLFTAEWPGRHGFLGWFLHLPALGDAVTPYRWVRTRDGARLDALGVECILKLREADRWQEGESPYGLPKVRVYKLSMKKKKKKKKEDEEDEKKAS